MSPMIPPPITNHAGFSFVAKINASVTTAIRTETGSKMAYLPSCKVTPAMRARETTFTPSRMPDRAGEFLRRGIKGRVLLGNRASGTA